MPARCSSPSCAREEQAGRDVLPVAVEDVAGDDEEFRAAFDGLPDERLDRRAIGPGERARDRGVLGAEAGERTVDVQIGGVEEMESHAAGIRGCGGDVLRRRARPGNWAPG